MTTGSADLSPVRWAVMDPIGYVRWLGAADVAMRSLWLSLGNTHLDSLSGDDRSFR